MILLKGLKTKGLMESLLHLVGLNIFLIFFFFFFGLSFKERKSKVIFLKKKTQKMETHQFLL